MRERRNYLLMLCKLILSGEFKCTLPITHFVQISVPAHSLTRPGTHTARLSPLHSPEKPDLANRGRSAINLELMTSFVASTELRICLASPMMKKKKEKQKEKQKQRFHTTRRDRL